MVVFITGASSGIGLAIARAFALNGSHLVLAARRFDRLRDLAADLPCPSHLIQLDVRDRAEVHAAVAGLPAAFQPIDVLVNNAGLSRGLSPLHEGDETDWEEMIDTNLKGLLSVTRAVLPGMVARRRGHVINIGSVAGRDTYVHGNVYCATKAAVRALNRAARLDVHGSGVRVTGIDPGMVATEFSDVRFHGDRQRADRVYADTRPLSAADVAEAVVWCVTRPPSVNVEEILLMPTDQAAPSLVHRGASASDPFHSTPIAERWLAAWNRHDVQSVLALYAADARHSNTGTAAVPGGDDTAAGRDAIGAHVKARLQQHPALQLEPVSVSTGPRTVAIECRVRGAGTGMRTIDLLELNEGGMIAHSRRYRSG